MNSKNPDEIVAVKCEGCFTEWYSPNFKEPYEDNAEYRKYYEEHILEVKPVIGPSLGESDDEYITDDLQCHAERMCCDSSDWATSTEDYMTAIEASLADGKPRTWEDTKSDQKVKITPYKRSELPPVNEESLKVYGEYAELLRKRIAEI